MLKSLKKSKNESRITGTREWADYNVNCIFGCYNDCRYCYAKNIAKRFGRATDETWKNMRVNLKKVEKDYGKKSGRVMFPSSHDIIDDSEILDACFTVLSNLLDNGNEVLVTSKPRLNVIRQIISKFENFQENIQFRFTITSINSFFIEGKIM